jgi:hypothetical protein
MKEVASSAVACEGRKVSWKGWHKTRSPVMQRRSLSWRAEITSLDHLAWSGERVKRAPGKAQSNLKTAHLNRDDESPLRKSRPEPRSEIRNGQSRKLPTSGTAGSVPKGPSGTHLDTHRPGGGRGRWRHRSRAAGEEGSVVWVRAHARNRIHSPYPEPLCRALLCVSQSDGGFLSRRKRPLVHAPQSRGPLPRHTGRRRFQPDLRLPPK